MPACARRELVREGEVGIYHCVQRCVRRAFLCGLDELTGAAYDHRREWIRDRLEELARIFSADVYGFAVMANHLHVIVRVRPDLAALLGDEELARRWWRLCPKRRERDGRPAEPTARELETLLEERGGGEERVKALRDRLSSLSWLMRCLAEPIARRANREDRCTGRFWEGRFKSQTLLDEQAILACSIYVDLNPIRAGTAETPETSAHTSAKERIDARQARLKLEALAEQAAATSTSEQAKLVAEAGGEAMRDRWLCEIGPATGYLPSLNLDDYLQLLDVTGRQIQAGKRGFIEGQLHPILERLQIDVEHWVETVTGFGRWFRRAAGTARRLCEEAARAGRRWLQGIGYARQAFAAAQ